MIFRFSLPAQELPTDYLSSDCDKKWLGIAVRIEDDILITEDGWTNLSEMAPGSADDLEAMMALPSPLDDFILPDLDGKN